MKYYSFVIFLLFALSCIKTVPPPPIPEPVHQDFNTKPKIEVLESNLKKFYTFFQSSSEDPEIYVNDTKARINFLKDGYSEEKELNVTTKNLQKGYYYPSYAFYVSVPEGRSIQILENACKILKFSNNKWIEEYKCTPNAAQDGNYYKFSYSMQLQQNQYLIINYKFIIKYTQSQQILYRQEFVTIQCSSGFCDYVVTIPTNYKSLGLQQNILQKNSDYIYSYKNKCPSESVNELLKFAPKICNWNADYSFFLESSTEFKKSSTLNFPRYYRGGHIRNKNYVITTNGGIRLEESDIINNEINLKAVVPGTNTLKVGVYLHTEFSNELDKDFDFYPSQQVLSLESTIDSKIKSKVQEVINDSSAEYKGLPDYHKIGKFVNSYITYDLNYVGKNLSPLQIFEGRRGVCEHFTVLYNAMLNVIGIKTVKLVGWALQGEVVSATEKTAGHAWTGAFIDGKIKTLDATWALFEGLPAGHILKAFQRESYGCSSYNKVEMKITHNIYLVDIADGNDSDNSDSNKNDNDKSDNNKDDTNKSDNNNDDTNKSDNNKDDTNKSDNNNDDTNKSDNNKDDTNKSDNNNTDSNKGDNNNNDSKSPIASTGNSKVLSNYYISILLSLLILY